MSVIFFNMPQRNSGTATLLVAVATAMLFPWVGMVLALLRRLASKRAAPEVPTVEADLRNDREDGANDPDRPTSWLVGEFADVVRRDDAL